MLSREQFPFSSLQEEYLDAINKQEIAKKELGGVTRQQEQLQIEISTMEKDSARLSNICREQDELLGMQRSTYL